MVSERDDSPGPGDPSLHELESLLRRHAVPAGPGSIRFVGGTVLLRFLPAAVMLAGLVTLVSAGIDALPAAAALVLIGVLAARSAPWRFVVVDEGIALWSRSAGGASSRGRTSRCGWISPARSLDRAANASATRSPTA